MKGVLGFIGLAMVIYAFWVTWEYFYNKKKNKNSNNNKNKQDEN